MSGAADRSPSLPGPEAACLERTRSAVLNVLVVAGAAIAASGLFLRTRARGATLWPPTTTRRACIGVLFGLIFASFAARRVIAARSALRDPAARAPRFYRAHVLAAAIGALAVPLGFAYGFAVEPRLPAVLPFWVAGLALGFLALPRPHELEGFDEPMTRGPGETPS